MKIRVVLIAFVWLLHISAVLADVNVTASAPSVINEGGSFRLSFKISSLEIESVSDLGEIDGFEILYGPSRSTSQSVRIINGKTTSESSTTLTYTLRATKKGSYTLPKLSVKVGGKSYTSNAVKIEVVEGALPGQQQSSGNSGQSSNSGGQSVSKSTKTSGKDLFITVVANKKEVYEQEPILLTYKVYTKLNLTQLSGKMPDLNGFMSKEIELPKEKNFTVEPFGGENYYTVEWSKYVMFPQQTGKLSIPSIKFEGVVVYEDRSIDPFDAFFNGLRGGIQKKRTIVAPGVDINVKPLPAGKPDNFSGGVGQFKIKSTLLTKQPKTGESIDLEVVISGVGNLDLVAAPTVQFPDGFDTYEPRQKVNTKITTSGMQGSMTVNYVAIPQSKGKYTIPAIEFSYFDPSAGKYKTLHTEPIDIEVAQGSKTTYSGRQQEIDAKSDIRYLKKWNFEPSEGSQEFYGSTRHVGAYVGVSLLGILIGLLLFRMSRSSGATTPGRQAGGNKRCLKRARRMMHAGREDAFYEELLSALHGYLSRKLGIPLAEISESAIEQRCSERGLSVDIISEVTALLSQCEMHRYAATQSGETMEQTYERATRLISELDKNLRKTKSKRSNQAVVLLLLLYSVGVDGATVADSSRVMPAVVAQQTLVEADSLYDAAQYDQSIALYEDILQSYPRAYIYYNLGNAYYRTNNIAKAILNYERAYLLNPADEDISYNLALARTKTQDKVEVVSSLSEWLRSLLQWQSVDTWALIGLLCFVAAIVGLLAYLFCGALFLRKLGFGVAVIGIVLSILFNVMAFSSHRNLIDSSYGIVMGQSTVRSTPSASGNSLFTLHEGTKVKITDSQIKDWFKIELPDGKVGWMERERVERI